MLARIIRPLNGLPKLTISKPPKSFVKLFINSGRRLSNPGGRYLAASAQFSFAQTSKKVRATSAGVVPVRC